MARGQTYELLCKYSALVSEGGVRESVCDSGMCAYLKASPVIEGNPESNPENVPGRLIK